MGRRRSPMQRRAAIVPEKTHECMSSREPTWRLCTSLESRLGVHIPIIEEVTWRLESVGWSDKDVFAIQLALEESLTNAVKHGNKEDCAKCVHLECEVDRNRFWAHIRDEGEGFCLDAVPDPTDEGNLTAVGGRGVLLIKAYMTDVSYNATGNCVTLLKLRETADSAPNAGDSK